MDPAEFPAGKSPRRELQGPRPTPLKVRKDSHKIRKPPVAPPPNLSQPPPHHEYRPPVIIYTVSPKVIHTDPSEFMTLVQRLTGSSSSSYSSSSSSSAATNSSRPLVTSSSSFSSFPANHGAISFAASSFMANHGAISPAARFASVEKTKSPEKKAQNSRVEGMHMTTEVESINSLFPGILSPGPAALPPILPNFFSPPSDPNSLSYFPDLSPVLQGNKNYLESIFMPSPSNFLSTQTGSPIPSPDIFNHFFGRENQIRDYERD